MMQSPVLTRLEGHARLVTAALSARFVPDHDTEDLLEVMGEMTPRRRSVWMMGALGVLFALALVSAQLGVWGLGAYFLAIVLLMR